MNRKINKPQMMAPRVTPLEDVCTQSTVTPVDCVHTYASALAYVDGRPQGAQPLTYAQQSIRVVWESRTVRFRHDERRLIFKQSNRTRMTRIRQIFTDTSIRAHQCQPLRQLTSPTRMALAIRGDPCSISSSGGHI